MATGEKWTAQAVATTFDSGDIMSIVQSGTNKQVDHDVLMDDAQICKAWVNFNGTGTVAIRDDFNVSSITDNGTGDYTVNFTNALNDANYSVVGSTTGLTSANPVRIFVIKGDADAGASDKTTAHVTIQTGSSTTVSVLDDMAEINVQIFGS